MTKEYKAGIEEGLKKVLNLIDEVDPNSTSTVGTLLKGKINLWLMIYSEDKVESKE